MVGVGLSSVFVGVWRVHMVGRSSRARGLGGGWGCCLYVCGGVVSECYLFGFMVCVGGACAVFDVWVMGRLFL